MSRPRSIVPSYRKHRASGQALVTLAGVDRYLGTYGSAKSKRHYERLIGEWVAQGRPVSPTPDAANPDADAYTVDELLAAYLQHAKTYYRKPDGTPTSEVTNVIAAIRSLRALYGKTAAKDFSPLKFKAVRNKMVESGRCRPAINKDAARLKMVFKWAVENELIPANVHHGLQAVAGLKAGRCEAPEPKPVLSVPEHHARAVLPFVSRQVGAMIELQLVTGMRPGEVTQIRGCDLNRTAALWIYTPATHKTAHHGHARTVYLGPKAQAVLTPFLRFNPDEYLFRPADADAERRERLHARRKTPMSCGNKPGTNKRRKPAMKPGECYTVTAYCRAIARACEQAYPLPAELDRLRGETIDAFLARLSDKQRVRVVEHRKVNHWHPHRLRHTAATAMRKQYGLEAAQVLLGHKTLTVTQIYAEKNVEAAMRIAASAG